MAAKAEREEQAAKAAYAVTERPVPHPALTEETEETEDRAEREAFT
jgi:hypothetical protein